MRLSFFDIETYKQFFCFCGITYDSVSHEELDRLCIKSTSAYQINQEHIDKIDKYFSDSDYIISYNGSRFDLPILARLKHDISKFMHSSTFYVYKDAMDLITYDENRNSHATFRANVPSWSSKHFDMLNNCLMDKSLKQWEMYLNLPIKELPYPPDAELTEAQKDEIANYCFHDVWATSIIYWRFGSGEQKTKYHTLPARKAILEAEWPSSLPFKFDRTAQAIASGIIYRTTKPIPVKGNTPLEIFKLNEFDVPDEVKDIIKRLTTTVATTAKEKRELALECSYKGIQFGKGGCHFIRTGRHDNIYCFDVQSEYPRIIRHWNLLKTPSALERWDTMMKKRFELKALKGTPEYDANLDLGYKVMVLNALSGGFRINSGTSVAYDPAVGEAMCYIGQLIVTELALACPNFDDVVEINTDSVFVVGEHNAQVLREKAMQMLVKYDMLFEEEFIDTAYFRDVNNYIIYDKEGKLLDGRGLDYSDMINKNHETAVTSELFNNLLKDKLDVDFKKYPWTSFIYKWHKSASSKYAVFNGTAFDHKNYYFLWTTRDCPDSGAIQFTNTLMDTRNGSIKARWGVYAFVLEDLSKYKDFIDYRQYQMDLDENFWLWDKKELITTFYGDTKTRRMNGVKTPRTIKEITEYLYPWTKEMV